MLSYTTFTLGLEVPALLEVAMDWDNVLDIYKTGEYNEAQAGAVATLMRYCGQSCYMDYTPEASAAAQDDQMVGLMTFGYHPGVTYIKRDNYDDDEWNRLLQEELGAGRPVSYVGYGSEAGHSFVLDGCKDGKYHVNWGWGGRYDGFFSLDLLGSGGYSFNYYQSMLYGLYPDPESGATVCYDFEQDGIYCKQEGDGAVVVNRDYGFNSYSGHVSIPETVTCGGRTLTVTAIGDGAFMRCGGLTSVDIPATVTTVGHNAFTHCDALTELTIGKNIVSIGASAFSDCNNLRCVEVEDIAAYCRITFGDFYSVPFVNGARLYHQGQEVKDLVIPGEAGRVSDLAFMFCDGVERLTVQEGVTSLGMYSFWECFSLVHVELPSTLISIEEEAFSECYKLQQVVFKEGLKRIDDYAFYFTRMQEAILPSTLERIGYASFAYCDSLKCLVMQGGNAAMDTYAFYGCTSLESVKLSPRQAQVGAYAFYGCKAMTSLDLGESVELISQYAFYGCNHLTQVSFPASVIDVGSTAFSHCNALARVDAASVENWCSITFHSEEANPVTTAHHLFVAGEEVVELVIPEGVTVIGNHTFRNCEGLQSLSMGNGVTEIGTGAFSGCENLQTVMTGDGLRTIGEKAFSVCAKLSTLTLGAALESIGPKAFATCVALTDITCRAETPPVLDSKACFLNTIFNKATLRVPAVALDAYKTADVWNLFKTIVPVASAIVGDVNMDGELSIADINATIDAVSQGQPNPLADVNGDGEVTIADVNAVIDIILKP